MINNHQDVIFQLETQYSLDMCVIMELILVLNYYKTININKLYL